jgi:hypothetical protein
MRASNLALAEPHSRVIHPPQTSSQARRCRRKFLRFFPGGFQDETYRAWERDYKWNANREWDRMLNQASYSALLREGNHAEVALRAVRIEARTNLIFSFEKMALRDAVKVPEGARMFAIGLYDFLHGKGEMQERFERWCDVVAKLPRKQTRVLTWPIVTVFGFLAQPEKHIFLKPTVTRTAAREYGFSFHYQSRPEWQTYASCLKFAQTVRDDLADLEPQDMIDLQSFIWVQGSSEYDE